MKEFWKDYAKLCMMSAQFCKMHWKGVIMLNAGIIIAEIAYMQIRYNVFDLNVGKKTKEDEAQ